MEDHVIGFKKGKGVYFRKGAIFPTVDMDYEYYWCNGNSYRRCGEKETHCYTCGKPLSYPKEEPHGNAPHPKAVP